MHHQDNPATLLLDNLAIPLQYNLDTHLQDNIHLLLLNSLEDTNLLHKLLLGNMKLSTVHQVSSI